MDINGLLMDINVLSMDFPIISSIDVYIVS